MNRVAIIGCGPRGLSVLERLVAHAPRYEDRLEVVVIEPGELGTGVHSTAQPDYLMLNSVAGQATAFSDAAMVPGAPVTGGPTFLEWCQDRELTPPGPPGDPPREMAPSAFMRRKDFGGYLRWAADWLLTQIPNHVVVNIVKQVAVRIEPLTGGARVTLGNGAIEDVDLAVVTTGHGLWPTSERSLRLVSPCYPLPDSVSGIPSGVHVAIDGTGLAGFDVMAAMTRGRGGRFSGGRSALMYHPSGEEPYMHLVNRSGYLPCARPERPRFDPAPTRALTREAVATLRQSREHGKLGYEVDVVPLIRAELDDEGLTAAERTIVDHVMGIDPAPHRDIASYHARVAAQAELDIREAEKGIGRSLLKDRLEAFRDGREGLRAIVADPGLADDGHRRFFAEVPEMANRAGSGPPIDRILELMALYRAGIVTFGPGPAPKVEQTATGWRLQSTKLESPSSLDVSTMVMAYIPMPPAHDSLRQSLDGWAVHHPDDERFLHLTEEGWIRDRSTGTLARVALFGPAAEGSNYYNNFIPWPGTWSRLLTGIDAVISVLF